MKSCAKCKELKPKTEFGKDSKRLDKLNPYCLRCRISDNAEYYRNNKEQIRKKCAEKYAANPERNKVINADRYWARREKELARCAEKYQKNKEKILARQAEYYANNKEKHFALIRKRRAKVKGAGGVHTASDIARLLHSQRQLCANCETKLFKSGPSKFHVDHIMPVSKGGSNGPDNLQCLCPPCNRRKSAKLPEEWAALNGRLF